MNKGMKRVVIGMIIMIVPNISLKFSMNLGYSSINLFLHIIFASYPNLTILKNLNIAE